ncbi:antitermination protein NusG [Flaviaesturariibacter aridisoli]|uniref:Antitermination protein NusG n=2 Tax=Flaviaesturariibacter aridisoli TaxID=2545761 RepID=A0A4R4DYT3_9BACT|nr:antitermination protein NusG [Flaviaesturariibacter aridisoli]
MLTYKTFEMNTFLPQGGQWYALCTRPKCEKKVAAALTKKRFETYLPLRMTQSPWSFLKKTELEPLFPGLVFVRLQDEQKELVRHMSGVIGLLHWLNQPAVIRDDEISLIKTFLASHQNVRTSRTAVRREPVLVDEPASDYKVARMQHTVSSSLSSLGYVLIADMPQQKPQLQEEAMPRIYPYYRYTDAS